MSAWPDAERIAQFLSHVRRRLVLVRLVEGAAIGLVLATIAKLAGANAVVAFGIALVPALVRLAFGDQWRFGWWRSLPGIAERLERRTPRARNLIVTASELVTGPRSYVNDAVMSRATALVGAIDAASFFPVRNAVMALVVGALAFTFASRRPEVVREMARVTTSRPGAPSIGRIDVTVTPPAYSGLQPATLTDPARIEALAGSRIELRIVSGADSMRLETLGGIVPVVRGNDVFSVAVTAETDGFLALAPLDSTGTPGARHLIGLTVTPDRAPRVTLASPGRDLFFSNVPASLPVAVNADDDLGLASLRLQYTAVSGSGERFTFTERDVPLTLSAPNAKTWTARGTWPLTALELAPGDLVVYRAIATDRRPGSAPVESESYVLEVVTPGAVAAEGFAADDQRDRYAVSQQMVILKTERLIARRAGMATDSVTEASRTLAAEQRSVRAEFVFMMGGELEDIAGEAEGTLELNEVAEAEAEGDLLAGRLQNQGRIEMMRAIRAMSRAATSLNEENLDVALQQERTALDNLMRAFARSRFILRALTQRERIDLERRLSGSLLQTAGLSGPAAIPVPDERTIALRRLLADVATMASRDSSAAERATAGALELLRADPGSDTLQRVASRVQEIARVLSGGGDAGMKVDSLLNQVSSLVAASLPTAPDRRASLEAGRLEGALRDARRRVGSRQ